MADLLTEDKTPSKFIALLYIFISSLLVLIAGGLVGYLIVNHISYSAIEKYKVEQIGKKDAGLKYSGNVSIISVGPVVANFGNSSNDWIRIETSIVINKDVKDDPLVIASKFKQDLLGYIRTLTFSQIQGPSGLLYLREDINDRAKSRFGNSIQEVVLESLVIH